MGNMDEIFPMREKLRDDMLIFRREKGISKDQVAVLLKKKPSSLHSILYDRTRHVGTEFLQLWCALSGHSLTEYLDDPGSPLPGLPQEDWGKVTEEERVMLRAMASDLARLRPELRRHAFNAWTSIIQGYQASGN